MKSKQIVPSGNSWPSGGNLEYVGGKDPESLESCELWCWWSMTMASIFPTSEIEHRVSKYLGLKTWI